MKLKAKRELPEARIEIIPMIDVMLFLLVFFMLSSLSLARLNGLPVDLPSAQNTQNQNATPPTLTVRLDGAFFLNKTPVSRANLRVVLRAFAGQTLLINADENAKHGAVVEAMDAARSVGIERFSIAATP